MGQYKHPGGGAWLEFSITHKDKEIPWKSLGESCDSDGKEWDGFHSGKMILGGMVVGIRAGLLERRRKWENQKAGTESSLCVQDETDTPSRSRGVVCREVSVKSGGLGSGILGQPKQDQPKEALHETNLIQKRLHSGGFPRGPVVKNMPAMQGTRLIPAPGRFHRPRRD